MLWALTLIGVVCTSVFLVRFFVEVVGYFGLVFKVVWCFCFSVCCEVV